MEDAQTKVSALQANNAADAEALAALASDLAAPATESVGDQALAAVVPVVQSAGLVSVFGTDPLVSALQAAGYTVTAPDAPAA